MANIIIDNETYNNISKITLPTTSGNVNTFNNETTLKEKIIKQDGTYYASSDNANAYSKVTVDITAQPVYYIITLAGSPVNSLNASAYIFFNPGSTSLDFTGCNTSSITSMSRMFYNCTKLTLLNISSFDTSNVTSMREMFRGCNNVPSLNLSSFNTSNVTDMETMFGGCSSLTSLDLSNFNTDNVRSMYEMFQNCSSLTSLDIRNFNFNFFGATKLFQGVPSTCKIYVNQTAYNWLLDQYNNGNDIQLADLSMLQVVSNS